MENLTAEKTREVLRKVRRIEIRTKRLVTNALAGAYHSVFKGQGMDFEEVREYSPGDDVRSIDWNVTAKMDRPFIKKFREERELTIMLLVDLSASGNFGSRDESKREIAAELASVLAFSAMKNNDKIGLILFTDCIEAFYPPKKGRLHVLHLIREILFFSPKHKRTNIKAAIEYLNQVTKHNAVAFLVSDFIEETSESEKTHKALEIANRKYDMICVRLSDPRELQLPPSGILTLEDAETAKQITVDTNNPHNRAHYEKTNKERLSQFEKQLEKKGIDLLKITTEEHYIKPLRLFLQKRMSRR